MKFLSSSSSSASSTITTTTTTSSASCDNNYRNSSLGCLTTVLRRLLCFNVLPTNPLNHSKRVEDGSPSLSLPYDQHGEIKERNEFAASGSANAPSVVAKLMGLEPVPRIHPANAQLSPGHIARSRSSNSVDSMRNPEKMQGRSRRVKSSSSVLEALTFVELVDEQFFILSFENADQTKKIRSRGRKSEKQLRESEQRKTEMCTSRNKKRENSNDEKESKENQDINSKVRAAKVNNSRLVLPPLKNSNENSHGAGELVKQSKILCSKQSSEEKRRSIMYTKENSLEIYREIDNLCGSENTSPVSVLDYPKYPVHQEVPGSEEESSRLRGTNARRTLVEELKNYKNLNSFSQNTCNSSGDCQPKRTEGKSVASRKDWDRHKHADLWIEVGKLAEPDILHCSWVSIELRKCQYFQEIGEVLGWEIFEQLLLELLNQLFESCHKNLDL